MWLANNTLNEQQEKAIVIQNKLNFHVPVEADRGFSLFFFSLIDTLVLRTHRTGVFVCFPPPAAAAKKSSTSQVVVRVSLCLKVLQ